MNKDTHSIFGLYESITKDPQKYYTWTITRPEGDWGYAPQWDKDENDKGYWWHLVVPPDAVSGNVWSCDISGQEDPDPVMIKKWLELGKPTRETYGTIAPLTKEIINKKHDEYLKALKSNEHGLDLTF